LQLVAFGEVAVLPQGLKECDQQYPAKLLVQLRADALYELGQKFRHKLQS
jgi:hypothetical protein